MNGQSVAGVGTQRYEPPAIAELEKSLRSNDPMTRIRAASFFRARYVAGSSEEERAKAGRELGYSEPRILVHEVLHRFGF